LAEWTYVIHPLRASFAATMSARGELRPSRISLLRGRDPGDPRAGLG
jgi:hypothetical protein